MPHSKEEKEELVRKFQLAESIAPTEEDKQLLLVARARYMPHYDEGAIVYLGRGHEFLEEIPVPHMLMTLETKPLVSSFILRCMAKARAEWSVFASAAWATILPVGKNRENMPADMGDWPEEYRSESVLLFLNRIYEINVALPCMITRDKTGAAVANEMDWGMCHSGGAKGLCLLDIGIKELVEMNKLVDSVVRSGMFTDIDLENLKNNRSVPRDPSKEN